MTDLEQIVYGLLIVGLILWIIFGICQVGVRWLEYRDAKRKNESQNVEYEMWRKKELNKDLP